MSTSQDQTAASPLRYHVAVVGDEAIEPQRVRGEPLTAAQIELIERKCNVKLQVSNDQGQILIGVTQEIEQKSKTPHLRAAVSVVTYALKHNVVGNEASDFKEAGLTEDRFSRFVSRTVSEQPGSETDRRRQKRYVNELIEAFKDSTIKKQPQRKNVVSTEYIPVSLTYDDPVIKSFLEFCLKRAGDKPLKVFQEDKRIGVTVKAIEAADGPLFMAEWNIYDDNTDNEYEIDLVTKVLIEAAERKNSVQSTKVTYDWLGGLIDKHLAPVERREKRAEKKTDAAKEPSRPVDTKMFAVRLASINGYSFHDFIAQYMSPDKGEGRSGTSRLSSLRAFQENKDLKGAQVAIDKSATPYAFTVTVPAGSGGTADMNTYNIVCHILGEAQQTWARAQEQRERSQANVEFSSINKEWFKTRIKEIVEKTADGGLVISPVFKTQAQGRVMLPGSAVPGREIVHGDKLAGRFHAAAEVSNLPDFTPDGSLIFRHEILTPTDNQRILMDLIDTKDIVFADGPAGSGKTLWTCFMALQGLRQGRYQKIAIAAPAVEAEEQHGFLPGSINKKMDPFINQILETFDEILGNGDSYVGKPLREKLVSTGLIEIAPHAFNRGRTYKNTLYILDECQNASWKQLMTALTRLGTGSTFVFMGDDRQNDRTSKQSAFVNFVRRFTKDTYQDYIGAVKFGPADVRRHPLLKLIMEEGDDVAPEEFKYGQDSRSGRNGSGGYRPRTPEPPEPGPRAVPSTVAPQ